jgi:thiamine pyrophosphokinase
MTGPAANTLLLLGGRPPDPGWLRGLTERNLPDVWAVDGGVASCRAAGAAPSKIIGDGDSAAAGDWAWALSEGAVERVYETDKDLTDFQLALQVRSENFKKQSASSTLIISGCFGGALDHLLSLFDTFALGWPEDAANGRSLHRVMIDDREGAFFIYSGGGATLNFRARPSAVSLIPVSEVCRGVSVRGVKWPLDGVTLERRFIWTVSNEAIERAGGYEVTAECEEGALALYWRFFG